MQSFPIAQFVAGVFFAAVCLVILWKCFGAMSTGATPGQLDIVHFICALCGGAAGAFLTGTALLSLEKPLSGGGSLVFSGTAGVAMFGLVFLVLRLSRPKAEVSPPPPKSAVVVSGAHNPFHQIANMLAFNAGGSIDLSGMTAAERDVVPSSESLRCGTLEQARRSLERLGELVPAGSMRPYSVHLNNDRFTLNF